MRLFNRLHSLAIRESGSVALIAVPLGVMLAVFIIAMVFHTTEVAKEQRLLNFLSDTKAYTFVEEVASPTDIPSAIYPYEQLPEQVATLQENGEIVGTDILIVGSQVSFCRKSTRYVMDFDIRKTYSLSDSEECGGDTFQSYVETGVNSARADKERELLQRYGIEHIAGTRVIVNVENETVVRCLGTTKEILNLATADAISELDSPYCI